MNRSITLVTCLAMFGFIATAEAHFKLKAPAANLQQSELYGDPQKDPPCGGAGTPTNMVTDVRSGTMLSITIDETIFHSGFYRVAVAQDMAGLPPAPTVADTNCNGLMPTANPTLPVLADGLFLHTGSFGGVPQTAQVPIPAGMTCNNCVLQIIQYMYPHGQPCFYYHCATVNISPDAPLPPDGGINPGVDAGMDPTDPGTGCCSAGRDSAVTGLLGGLVVGLLALRRRRRR